MSVYYFIAFLIGTGCIIYDGLFYANPNIIKKRQIVCKFHYFLCCAILLFVLGMRAKFSSDYITYENIYYNISNTTWDNILSSSYRQGNIEIGFRIFAKLISMIEGGQDTLPYILIIAGISLIPVFYIIWKNSGMPFLSLFLFYLIGYYFNSFNTMRSCMACGISFLLIGYIEKRKFKRYLFCVLFLVLIHNTMFFLIPLYFVIRQELFKGMRKVITFAVSFASFFMIDIIIKLVDLLFYNSFYTLIYTGNSFEGISFGSTVPAIVVLILLLFANKFCAMEEKYKILINGSYIWVCIRVLSMSVGIAIRIADLLCIYPILFIPLVINHMQEIFRVKGNYYKIKFFVTFFTTLFLILWLWFIMRYSPYNPYKFIWE